MLLSVTIKVISRIILNRITTKINEQLCKEQAGFRKGRSCADQVFRIRQIIEQGNEWNFTVNFIYFTMAFSTSSMEKYSVTMELKKTHSIIKIPMWISESKLYVDQP